MKEISLKNKNKNFQQKENGYILTIYRLEDEINNLTKLLKENKKTDDKIKEYEIKCNKQEKKIEIMQNDHNKEINELTINNNVLRETISELREQNNELENVNKNLKDKNEIQEQEYITLKEKKEALQKIVKEKDGTIEKLMDKLDSKKMFGTFKKGINFFLVFII